MERDELRTLMADYLDGLLADEGARDVEQEIARAPGLLAEVARGRARLYRPYPVPAPPSDLAQRIRERHRRPLSRVVRYAAVFAAGVVTTLILQFPPGAPTPAETETEQARPETPAKVWNRRIR